MVLWFKIINNNSLVACFCYYIGSNDLISSESILLALSVFPFANEKQFLCPTICWSFNNCPRCGLKGLQSLYERKDLLWEEFFFFLLFFLATQLPVEPACLLAKQGMLDDLSPTFPMVHLTLPSICQFPTFCLPLCFCFAPPRRDALAKWHTNASHSTRCSQTIPHTHFNMTSHAHPMLDYHPCCFSTTSFSLMIAKKGPARP